MSTRTLVKLYIDGETATEADILAGAEGKLVTADVIAPLLGVAVPNEVVEAAVEQYFIDNPASGDVVGPASSVNDRIAVFSGTSGKVIKQGPVLGDGALLDIGTGANTLAAGDDERIINALQPDQNLSELASPSVARQNLGLEIGVDVPAMNDARITGAAQKDANLTDLDDPSAARDALGLGNSATRDVGAVAGTVAAGDDARFTNGAEALAAAEAAQEVVDAAADIFTARDEAEAAASTASAVAAITVPSHLTFPSEIIYDNANLYGTARAVYVPQNLTFRRGSDNFNVTLTPNSSELSGYVKVTGPASTTSVATVYLNLAEVRAGTLAALHVVDALGSLPSIGADFIRIGTFRGDNFYSPFTIWRTLERGARSDIQRVEFRAPMVVQADATGDRKLLIPAFYYVLDGVFTLCSPPDGYWELDVSDVNNVVNRHFFNLPAYVANPTTAGPETATGGNAPLSGGRGRILLATSLNGKVTSAYPLVGDVSGGSAPNQFPFGKTGMDLAGKSYLASAVAIDNAALTALGFTTGFKATSGGLSYLGQRVDDPAPVNAHVFFRAYYQTGTAGSFGAPEARVFFDDGTSQSFTLTKEKSLSTTAAIYSGAGRITNGKKPAWWWVGYGSATGLDLRVTGVQAYVGPNATPWIDRLDYPSALRDWSVDLALPPALWVTDGEPTTLFPLQALKERAAADGMIASLASAPSDRSQPAVLLRGEQMLIQPEQLGATADVVLSYPRNRAFGAVVARSVPVKHAPATASGTKKILVIGDSLSDRGLVHVLDAMLAARGYTAQWIGTTLGAPEGSTSESATQAGMLGETRPGKRFSDFTYERTNLMAPVAVGDEATYLALAKNSSGGKLSFNPFIRATVGGDPAGRVFNGYIFDLAFYLSRFSLSTPDIILIALGTNDIGQITAWGPEVGRGLDTLVGQCRAAAPSAKIGLVPFQTARVADANGLTSPENAVWAAHHVMILQHMAYVNALADPNVHVLPAWQMQSPEIGFPRATGTTDTVTGVTKTSVSDPIHFDVVNLRRAAQLCAAFVGAA